MTPAIGSVAYEPRAWSYGDKLVPCPVCYGKLAVVLELGNGERVTVECDGCGLGYDGPQGVVNMPCAGSIVTEHVITGIDTRAGELHVLCSANGYGNVLKWEVEAFGTREEAEAERARLFAEAEIDAEHRSVNRTEYLRKKPTWLVRHHRQHIRDAERDLAWHTRKLSDALARSRKPVTV